jgi:hypothetical protein
MRGVPRLALTRAFYRYGMNRTERFRKLSFHSCLSINETEAQQRYPTLLRIFNMTNISYPEDPTAEEALALFKKIEEKFPSTLGSDKWYIVTVRCTLLSDYFISFYLIIAFQFAAMVGGGQPAFAPTLYLELIKRAEYSTSEQRKTLMRRIRETMMKLVSIVGVCKPLEAIFDINAVTAPEDKDYSFSREGWQCNEENQQRGFAWQDRIYKHDQAKIDDVLSSQRDFGEFQLHY